MSEMLNPPYAVDAVHGDAMVDICLLNPTPAMGNPVVVASVNYDDDNERPLMAGEMSAVDAERVARFIVRDPQRHSQSSRQVTPNTRRPADARDMPRAEAGRRRRNDDANYSRSTR